MEKHFLIKKLKKEFWYWLKNIAKFFIVKIKNFLEKHSDFASAVYGLKDNFNPLYTRIKAMEYYIKKYKFTATSIAIFLVLVCGQNFVFPAMFKIYVALHSKIIADNAHREITTIPTDIKISDTAYEVKLTGATGYLQDLDSYAISPTRYAINGFIENKIKNNNATVDDKGNSKIIPQRNNFKTDLLYVDDRFIGFKNAEVKLRKFSKNEKINAIITCSNNDFDSQTNFCRNWQIFNEEFKDEDGYISFATAHFSVYAGAYLEVINFQSNLVQGGEWTVFFTTHGQSDLIIEGVEGTEFNRDLELIELSCGDAPIAAVPADNKIIVTDYICANQTSHITNKTLTAGKHKLKLSFGSGFAFAQNFACTSEDNPSRTCYVSDVQTVDNETINNPAGCGSTCVNLEISSGGELKTSTGTPFYINMEGDVTIKSGGKITGNLYSTSTNFTLDSGGAINANGKGKLGGVGTNPGAGYDSGDGGSYASNMGGGGGHGGDGGIGSGGVAGGNTNDSISLPIRFGSGGGGGGNNAGTIYNGGDGGGSINIKATGTTTLNDLISVNGNNGDGGNDGGKPVTYFAGGGGAGGSIMINTLFLAGTGTTTANGGTGYSTSTPDGGGGAGGRIAFYYSTSTASLIKQAYGGSGEQYGGAGTIYEKAATSTYANLTIDNNANTGARTDIAATSTFGYLTCQKGCGMDVNSNITLNVMNDFIGTSTASSTVNGTFNISTSSVALTDFTFNNYGTTTFPTSFTFNGTGTSTFTNTGYVSQLENLTVNGGSIFYYQNSGSAQHVLNLTVGNNTATTTAYFYTSTTSPAYFNNVTINSKGVITHIKNTGTDVYGLNLNIAGDLAINAGGYVNVDSKGYDYVSGYNGSGPGKGLLNSQIQSDHGYLVGGGAGYGGGGGNALEQDGTNSAGAGGTYGSFLEPADSGSSGGVYGTGGGGVIKLTVIGTTTINGTISANGSNGYLFDASHNAGSGSGGSIWIDTKNITGSGTISANGGAGYKDVWMWSGNGGGGRIAIYATSTTGFANLPLVSPGATGSCGGATGTYALIDRTNNTLNLYRGSNAAISGTYNYSSINIYNSSSMVVSANTNFDNGSGTFGGDGTGNFSNYGTTTLPANLSIGNFRFNQYGSTTNLTNLTINSGGTFDLQISSTTTYNLTNLTINSGGILTQKVNNFNHDYSLNLNIADDLTVNAGGLIDVSSKGYIGGTSTVGYAPAGTNGGGGYQLVDANDAIGGGGAYGGGGGQGAMGAATTTGGSAYGSSTAPTDIGAGGGGSNTSNEYVFGSGGYGGGATKIDVNGTFTINGALKTDGSNGSGVAVYGMYGLSGGGSGGSVWIIANTLVGYGTISANGGNGYYYNATLAGGGGGGGRIAGDITTNNFVGYISAAGGTGYQAGSAGSIDGLSNMLYRSVGNSSVDLKTAASTVTISSSTRTATFSAAQPDNVGIGDVIQYGGAGYYQLAFIYERASSTVYYVQAWDGGTPEATTSAAVAIYRAHLELNNWEAQTAANVNASIDSTVRSKVLVGMDLVASNTIMMVPCYYGTSTDDTAVTIDGWTTGADNYIKIYTPATTTEVGASQRHLGKWDSNKYKLEVNDSINIRNDEDYVRIDGLQINNISTTTGDRYGIWNDADATSDIQISNNIIKAQHSGASNSGVGVFGYPDVSDDNSVTKIWNNIIYDFSSNADAVGIKINDGASHLYNNTVYNCYTGITSSSTADTEIIKNNIVIGDSINSSFTDYLDIAGGTYGNNLSSDATSPDTTLRSKSVIFADATNDNFHLSPTDTSALNAGTSSVGGLFTTDIDGQTRDLTGRGWDIGADEGATAVYFSVGQNVLSHETGAGTITIAGTTATFSVAQTATTTGVGDVIDYGTNNSKCYIIGKTSTTVWSCVSATGGTPTATTTAAVNSITHAYASLSAAEAGASDSSHINTSDLFTSNYQLNFPCYYDSGPDTTAVTIDGWTTGEQNYIKVYTPYNTTTEVNQSQRHQGKWDDNKYRIESNSSVITIQDSYTYLDGIQIYESNTSNDYRYGIYISTGGDKTKISNSIIKGSIYSTGNYHIGIYYNMVNGYIWNNIIYDFISGENNRGIRIGATGLTTYVYNNTIYNCGIGFYRTAGTLVAKNNISYNNADNYSGTFDSSGTNNLSGPGTDAEMPTSGAQDGVAVEFIDAANDDFHLAPSDTVAVDAGTSTPATDTNLSFTDDIDGHYRRQWDIGADEASIEFVTDVKEIGGKFSSLSTWETSNQVNLIATSTAVFSISSASGTIAVGASVTGATSGAIASTTVFSTSSNQILLYNINGAFVSGEQVYYTQDVYYVVLSNLGNPAIATAKIDGAWTAADPGGAVTIDGWTTGPNNYIRIYTATAARHAGKWDDYKYVLTATNGYTLRNEEDFVRIDGLQVNNISNSSGSGHGAIYNEADAVAGNSDVRISNNLVRAQYSGTTNSGLGIYGSPDVSDDKNITKIWNNIVYDFGYVDTTYGTSTGISIGNGASIIFNNTIYDCDIGMFTGSGGDTEVIKNNIVIGHHPGYDYVFVSGYTYGNNISSDATSPDTAFWNKTVTFVDAANDDFHLSSSDTSALNAGVALWSDATSSFSTDIDGTSRGAAWDIGADEVPAEFTSTICENTSGGGDCANMDYSRLYDWEDKVETDLTASTTRVFGGSKTGLLSENDVVYLRMTLNGTSTAKGYVVATTSDQILIDGIVGSTTLPVIASTSYVWQKDGSNYWSVSGTNDSYGASPIAVAKIDGAWTVADTQAVNINGWTTDNDNYMKIYTATAARHAGKWDDTKYVLAVTANYALFSNEDYVRIDGLQVNNISTTTGSSRGAIYNDADVTAGSSEVHIFNNIIKAQYSASTTGGGGISGSPDAGDNNSITKIRNNIIYDFDLNSNCLGISIGNGASVIFNNTIYNCYVGMNTGSYADIETIYNNIVIGDSINSLFTDYSYIADTAGATHGHNISSDATSPDDAYDSKSVSFVDITNDNFHLSSSDIAAKNAGEDLSATSTLNFTTDIDGQTRNGDGMGWDIGADEASINLYRSVGLTATNLNTSNRTVTISGSTATFSDTMPDNVGVGDVLQYGTTNLAFITARASSTAYTVLSASGTVPVAATGGTAVSVYRAYNSLSKWESQDENDSFTDAVENFDNTVDLVASNTIMNAACYGDAVDTTAVTISGWTTGEQNYIKVYTPVNSNEVGVTQRHQGKWDDAKYRLEVTDNYLLDNYEDYVRIDGLQMMVKSTSDASARSGIWNEAGSLTGSDIKISNNIIKTYDSDYYSGAGIVIAPGVASNSSVTKVWNNIIYGFNHDSSSGGISIGTGAHYIYNNTIYNCYVGMTALSVNSENIKNNIVIGDSINSNYTDYLYVSGGTYGNNISSDATSPDTAYRSKTVSFVDSINHDFHLAPSDTAAIDAGTSTPATDTSLSFTDDIDGHYRRQWDIGADEASIEFVTDIKEIGGKFSSLSTWETSNQVNLIATTTAVFSISSASGTIAAGSSVTGATSGAIASTTVFSTSSNQILLYNINGTFQSGEQVYKTQDVHYVVLSNLGNPAIATAKIDGAWTAADPGGAVTIDGWTTGPNNYIRIYTTTAARHSGNWDDSKYVLGVTNGNNIKTNESYVRIDGLQVNSISTTAGDRLAIWNDADSSPSDVRISNNIVRAQHSGSSNAGTGIYGSPDISNSNNITKIWNNIVYDFNASANADGIAIGDGASVIYNNTVYNCYTGLTSGSSAEGDGEIIKNNISYSYIFNSAYYDYHFIGGEAGSIYSNNLSSDTTAPGTNSKTNQTIQFVDTTNKDFRLMPTDTAAKDSGTDLSGDTYIRFNTDIASNTRQDIAWDIGASEAPTIIYRSVGNDTSNLNTGAATVTISTSSRTATFSTGLANNIGAGDIIQYGGTGYYQLAVITGRTSGTVYSVSSATGSMPIATTTAAASVYRAHLFINYWNAQTVNSSINGTVQSQLVPSKNLVTSYTAMFVPCYASTSPDNLETVISGWTTATSSYINIYTPTATSEVGITQRHDGKWNDNKFSIVIPATMGSYLLPIYIIEPYIRIDGLQIKIAAGATDYGIIAISAYSPDHANGDVRISNNIIASETVTSAGSFYYGIELDNSGKIWNNIVTGIKPTGVAIYAGSNYSPYIEIYNNTVSDSSVGMGQFYGGTVIAENNAVFNNTDDFSGTFTTLDYNASDDLDGTHAINISPNAVEATDWALAFTDYANGDFSIKSSVSPLYDAGTTIALVTDDIIGTHRPQGGSYDIGAFEDNRGRPAYRLDGKMKLEGKMKME